MAITADIQQQVYDLLSRSSSLSFVTADLESAGRIALTPGQRVTAEIVGTLPNNRAQVQIGGQLFNLDLPMAVRLGQTLEMTFVSEDPRSTFAIARQGGTTPPVSLSDASRLLSLLISSEQIVDPRLRSSLQNIGDMLRRSSGEAGVLANLLDEALTYGTLRNAVKATPQAPGDSMQEAGNKQQTPSQQFTQQLTQDQTRLSAFESNASQILRNVAHNSRFVLVEAANPPPAPLPLLPGEDVNAVVVGSLPGGRTLVQVAGATLEMVLPRAVISGEMLRLTYISSQPKPTFAITRTQPDLTPSTLSQAGRWLSVLEHLEGGVSDQQMYVLERLDTVLKSLPPDSPAFTAIRDEAITYKTVMRAQTTPENTMAAALSASLQAPVPFGNGITLTDEMAKLLQAIIKGNRLALLETLSQQALPTGLMPGQQLKGEVLTTLGGGRFLVQVAGQILEFTMPKGIRRGDMLNLFFIAEEPQATFLLARFGKLGGAMVSETSRWVSGFMGAAAEKLSAGETTGILRSLLSSPPTDPSQVERMLQQELRGSGLFYESHLARWFGGEYPLADLLKEPQGQLSARIQQPQPTEQHSRIPADALAQAIISTGSSEIMEAAFKKAGNSMSHEGIADQRTLPIVNEQLSALQNGQHVFRGDLFPGQHMEWAVAERDSRRNQSGVRERTWETSVSINMPQLGPIAVRLILDGTSISLDVNAENSNTVAQLAAGRARLSEQLEAAGLKPADMNIRYAA